MKKVAFYTLGCKLNYSETSTISRLFEEKGYRKVEFTDTPDIFIINTCSVTENADKKCHKIVREARGISPNGYVAIIGCYAQLKPTEIASIPGVDAVLGAAEKFRLVELLDGFVRPPQAQVFASDINEAKRFNTLYVIQCLDQVDKTFNTSSALKTEVTRVHTGQYNFLYICLSDLAGSLYNIFNTIASAGAACQGDRTERTRIIAPVLNL